jgi:hypothetical protein
VVVALVALQGSPDLLVWAKWTVIALMLAYLFPFLYLRARVAVATRTTGVQVSLRSFFREQPNEMAILACIFGIPSATILYFLDAPLAIIATLVGVAASNLLVALVNRVYRASFHLAIFTSAVIPLAIILGISPLVVAPFVLLLGAARYYIKAHTPLQLVVGFLIGVAAATSSFYGFGLL